MSYRPSPSSDANAYTGGRSNAGYRQPGNPRSYAPPPVAAGTRNYEPRPPAKDARSHPPYGPHTGAGTMPMDRRPADPQDANDPIRCYSYEGGCGGLGHRAYGCWSNPWGPQNRLQEWAQRAYAFGILPNFTAPLPQLHMSPCNPAPQHGSAVYYATMDKTAFEQIPINATSTVQLRKSSTSAFEITCGGGPMGTPPITIPAMVHPPNAIHVPGHDPTMPSTSGNSDCKDPLQLLQEQVHNAEKQLLIRKEEEHLRKIQADIATYTKVPTPVTPIASSSGNTSTDGAHVPSNVGSWIVILESDPGWTTHYVNDYLGSTKEERETTYNALLVHYGAFPSAIANALQAGSASKIVPLLNACQFSRQNLIDMKSTN